MLEVKEIVQDFAMEIDKTAAILKLLGDKTRLTMVKLLDSYDCCVCEFVEIFKTSQPAISQYIRKLKDAGVVNDTRRGQWIFYSLNKKGHHYSIIQSLLQYLPN